MKPLAFASPNRCVEVVEISGGRSIDLRLKEIGIFPGVRIKVILNEGGPVVVSLQNSRFALGRGIALKIFVKEINEEV